VMYDGRLLFTGVHVFFFLLLGGVHSLGYNVFLLLLFLQNWSKIFLCVYEFPFLPPISFYPSLYVDLLIFFFFYVLQCNPLFFSSYIGSLVYYLFFPFDQCTI